MTCTPEIGVPVGCGTCSFLVGGVRSCLLTTATALLCSSAALPAAFCGVVFRGVVGCAVLTKTTPLLRKEAAVSSVP